MPTLASAYACMIAAYMSERACVIVSGMSILGPAEADEDEAAEADDEDENQNEAAVSMQSSLLARASSATDTLQLVCGGSTEAEEEEVARADDEDDHQNEAAVSKQSSLLVRAERLVRLTL